MRRKILKTDAMEAGTRARLHRAGVDEFGSASRGGESALIQAHNQQANQRAQQWASPTGVPGNLHLPTGTPGAPSIDQPYLGPQPQMGPQPQTAPQYQGRWVMHRSGREVWRLSLPPGLNRRKAAHIARAILSREIGYAVPRSWRIRVGSGGRATSVVIFPRAQQAQAPIDYAYESGEERLARNLQRLIADEFGTWEGDDDGHPDDGFGGKGHDKRHWFTQGIIDYKADPPDGNWAGWLNPNRRGPKRGSWQRGAWSRGWNAALLAENPTHFGAKYPAQWGVPDAALVRPGQAPAGWDPNLFPAMGSWEGDDDGGADDGFGACGPQGCSIPTSRARAHIGLDNAQRFDLGDDVWGMTNVFEPNPMDTPENFSEHFDGQHFDGAFGGLSRRARFMAEGFGAEHGTGLTHGFGALDQTKSQRVHAAQNLTDLTGVAGTGAWDVGGSR